jgi:DNA-binding NarL/FixJ family response regulator
MNNSQTLPRSATILIVDDHPLIREGLSLRIARHPEFQVCGEAEGVNDAMVLVKAKNPDLVIVDLLLKDSHGLDLIKQIKAWNDKIVMLVSSMYDEAMYAERVLRAGASGYINKHEMPELVIDAIRQVLQGKIFLSAEMGTRLMRRATVKGEAADQSPLSILSDRELEVFHLIGQGITTRAIATQLHLSIKTIETHRENIKAKLGIKNGAELTRQAIQWMLENG